MKPNNKFLYSLSFLFTTAYVALAVVVCCACYVGLIASWDKITADADERMFFAIRKLNIAIPPEYFDAAVSPDAISREQYNNNRKLVNRIISRHNLTYLYTMVEIDGHFYHTNTGISDLPYFEEYTDEWTNLPLTSADGKTRYNNGFDSFGETRACICRFTTPSGQNYLIGADIQFSEVQTLRWKFLWSCFPSTLPSIVITVIFSVLFAIISFFMIRERQWGLVIASWLLLFSVIAFSCSQIAIDNKTQRDTWDNYLLEWITIFAKETQDLGHAEIQSPLSEHPEGENAYKEILARHIFWKAQFDLILYIYTCRLVGENELEFIVSCPCDVNRDGIIEGRTEVGDPPFTPYYDDAEGKIFAWAPVFERGFKGQTSLDERATSRLYGASATCSAPLYGDNGDVEAILCIDFDVDKWERTTFTLRHKSINMLTYSCTCLLFVTSFFSISLRYLRKTAETNEVLTRALGELNEAQTAVKAKSSFLANMSHEIRTPMNAILGFASILLRGKLQPVERANVIEIRRASRHLLTILNDILDIAKIESGKITIVPVRYGIGSLVNDVVGTIGIRFIQKPEVRFFVEIDPHIPAMLIGDELRLRQGILNFLSNAVKFTDKGFVRLAINGEYANDGHFFLNIVVQDTGRGIKEEDKDKIFHAFEQVDTHRNRQLEGTGLGLAITLHIIEMANGTIELDTEYGKGATFSCKLPQEIISEETEQLVPDWLLAGESVIVYEPDVLEAKNWCVALKSLQLTFHVETHYLTFLSIIQKREFTHYFFGEDTAIKLRGVSHIDTSRAIIVLNLGEQIGDELSQSRFIRRPISSLSIASALCADSSGSADTIYLDNNSSHEKFIAPSAKILVVDDNDVNLKLAAGLLEPYQCQVQCVSSGKEAISMLQMKPFDLVFMDHMMPEMDGIEAVRLIRTFDTQTPIVALTANVVAGVQETYYREGFSDFIPKPIEIPNLEHIIKTWLPKYKVVEVKSKSMDSGIMLDASGVIAAPRQQSVEFDIKQGIRYSGENITLYHDVCKSFLDNSSEQLNTLKKSVTERDWQRFRIDIHAVKSTSKSIGAVTLSEAAKQLETFSKESNEMSINANWQEFLRLYAITTQKIKEYLDG